MLPRRTSQSETLSDETRRIVIWVRVLVVVFLLSLAGKQCTHHLRRFPEPPRQERATQRGASSGLLSTPLDHAIAERRIQDVLRLISQGVDLNRANPAGIITFGSAPALSAFFTSQIQ